MDFEQYEKLSAEENNVSVEKAIADYKAQSESTAIEEPPAVEEPVVTEPPVVEEKPVPETVVEEKPVSEPVVEEKKVQSPEENARFAEQRRQQQLEERVQAELKKRMEESSEAQMAKLLSEMYGKPPEQILKELQVAKVQRELQAAKPDQEIPQEVAMRVAEERAKALESQRSAEKIQRDVQDQLNQLKFQQWQTRIESEKAGLLSSYKGVLSPEDIDGSVAYMLQTLKNPDLPLDQVVFAQHGKKIADSLKEIARNEALAEVTGRAKSPVAPQSSGKTAAAPVLTDDELYVIKKMGISAEDYIKHKEG